MQPDNQKSKRGRKPVPDKKIQVSLYVEQSIIDAYGGRDAFIESTYHLIKNNKP